ELPLRSAGEPPPTEGDGDEIGEVRDLALSDDVFTGAEEAGGEAAAETAEPEPAPDAGEPAGEATESGAEDANEAGDPGAEDAPGGRVDRDAVANVVFDDPDARTWLERYLWPKVGERVAAWRAELGSLEPAPRAAVVEVPLLFESGMDAVFDHTIAVVADDDLRADRIGVRGHTGVGSRESRQLDQTEKAERADFQVRNDGTLDELERELADVLARMGA